LGLFKFPDKYADCDESEYDANYFNDHQINPSTNSFLCGGTGNLLAHIQKYVRREQSIFRIGGQLQLLQIFLS